MNPTFLRFLSLALALCLGPITLAQDEEPAPGKKSPAGTKRPTASGRADLLDQPDLVLESIREANPTTPVALTQAVQTLLDYGEPVEAKKYLNKLLETKPDQTVQLELHSKFGPAFFMQLGRDKRMAPEGAKLARSIIETAQAAARDATRLAELVEQLKDPSEGLRREAVVSLHEAGQLALPPLLKALADPAWAGESGTLLDAIVELGDLSVEPLLGALEAPDMAFRARVSEALGRLRTRRAVLHLVGPYLATDSSPELRQAAKVALVRIIGDSPTQYDAEQFLYRRAKSYLDGEPPRAPNYLGIVELWHWDEGQGVPVARRYTAQDAALVMAARTAADLYAIAPKNTDFRRLYLTAGLELQKMLGGMNVPLPQGPGTLHEAAKSAGVAAVEELLLAALKQNHTGAAAGACEVLGDMGTSALLVTSRGTHPPLSQALRHGDRRLQLVAAEAILRLDPRESFPGSSHLLETLGRAVATGAVRRALVVQPQAAAAQTLVGLLNEIGFEADAAATGRRGFQMAAEGTDYEFVLISDAVDKPDTNELFQMLRRDPRTARLPTGLLYRAETEQRTRRMVEGDRLSLAMPRPHSPETIGFEVDRLLKAAGRNVVLPEERLAQASRALGHFKRLAQQADIYSFYDLLRQTAALETALHTPELSTKAAQVLGYIGSPAAQRALATVASQHARPLAQRQAAAAGFAEAVQRRGTLLTTSEIRNQYELYNQSETLDAETQAVLASLLDAIEARAKRINPDAAASKSEPEDGKPAPTEGEPDRAEEKPAPEEVRPAPGVEKEE